MNRLRRMWLLLGVAAVIVVWCFRVSLRQRILEREALSSEVPSVDVLQEMIGKAPDPKKAIMAAWRSGKIVPREVAIQELSRVVPASSPLPADLESMVLAAALDPDNDVREVALSILESRRHPALTALAAAQLKDVDPQVRLLGLSHLKQTDASTGVPIVMPLLGDGDPRVVGTCLKLLEHWTGQCFGVKLSDTVPVEDEKTGLQEFRQSSVTKAQAGAGRARQWWATHKAEFKPARLEVPPAASAARQPLMAGDFQLHTLNGQKVQLSQFRGKVVLLNFWTTWCPACLSEIPALVALQKRASDHLVILGISLDSNGEPGLSEHASPEKIREKVERTVKARGMNYTVLLDEDSSVGGRFNGGELPTTVIVDAEGRVRRRFIGARSLPVFEAMIAAASQPTPGGALGER